MWSTVDFVVVTGLRRIETFLAHVDVLHASNPENKKKSHKGARGSISRSMRVDGDGDRSVACEAPGVCASACVCVSTCV
jgi:hypothetical protein